MLSHLHIDLFLVVFGLCTRAWAYNSSHRVVSVAISIRIRSIAHWLLSAHLHTFSIACALAIRMKKKIYLFCQMLLMMAFQVNSRFYHFNSTIIFPLRCDFSFLFFTPFNFPSFPSENRQRFSLFNVRPSPRGTWKMYAHTCRHEHRLRWWNARKSSNLFIEHEPDKNE